MTNLLDDEKGSQNAEVWAQNDHDPGDLLNMGVKRIKYTIGPKIETSFHCNLNISPYGQYLRKIILNLGEISLNLGVHLQE